MTKIKNCISVSPPPLNKSVTKSPVGCFIYFTHSLEVGTTLEYQVLPIRKILVWVSLESCKIWNGYLCYNSYCNFQFQEVVLSYYPICAYVVINLPVLWQTHHKHTNFSNYSRISLLSFNIKNSMNNLMTMITKGNNIFFCCRSIWNYMMHLQSS